MKKKIFKRNSLHYRLATVYGGMDRWDEALLETDCDYRGYVIKGFINVLLIIIFGALFSWLLVIAPVMYTVINLVYGVDIWMNLPDIARIGIIVDAAIIITIIIVTIVLFFSESKTGKEVRYQIRDKISESFIGHSWTAIKDKVCSRIEFED